MNDIHTECNVDNKCMIVGHINKRNRDGASQYHIYVIKPESVLRSL